MSASAVSSAPSSPALSLVASAAGDVDGGMPALVPPGDYRLKFETWSTVMLFGRQPKVVLRFRICDFGPHFELGLARWYNVTKLRGKVGRQGRFSVGWSSDLLRDFAKLVSMPHRVDRINLDALSGLLIVGRVETVVKDRSQGVLPSACHYSVVREIVGTA